MFVRIKKMKDYSYLQIVESKREGKKVKQRVFATLGRLDLLRESGKLDALAHSILKFTETLHVFDAHHAGSLKACSTISIGPELVFGRLWHELGIDEVIRNQGAGNRFSFPLERAIFLTVLHRIFHSGSDRCAENWKNNYRIPECEGLELHQLYRSMAWLGLPIAHESAQETDGLPPRCRKDLIEEQLFVRNRDLFSELEVVFFDTTSLYFEGDGGQTLGQYGHSKDHRSDEKQMIVGAVLDAEGRPICCQMWPGNTTDVTTLRPVVRMLKKKFHISRVCVVADRGMISAQTVKELESKDYEVDYILGVRLHRVKEVSEDVLNRDGKWQIIHPAKKNDKDPSPLKVREEWVGQKRYIVCLNPDQAKKDAADRQAILESLREKLKQGDKALVGNKGYRRYLKSAGEVFRIDENKAQDEERFDGIWVLQTNLDLEPGEVALKYKQLWMVESIFRSMKSVLETRPIYHKMDETIRGHVFCSFLALVLTKELESRMEQKGYHCEWADVIRDVEALQEVEIESVGQHYYLRTELKGVCHAVLHSAGVAVPPSVRIA
jgi:hypothetical protein